MHWKTKECQYKAQLTSLKLGLVLLRRHWPTEGEGGCRWAASLGGATMSERERETDRESTQSWWMYLFYESLLLHHKVYCQANFFWGG